MGVEKRERIEIGGREVADVEVDRDLVRPRLHGGGEIIRRRELIRRDARVIVEGDGDAGRLEWRSTRDAVLTGEGGDDLDAKRLGHLEAAIDFALDDGGSRN